MQEPIEFQLYRKLKAGEVAVALELSEKMVKKRLFNDWQSEEQTNHEKTVRPQACPGDVPLPLAEEKVAAKVLVAPESSKKVIELPAAKEKVEDISLGKPFVSLVETIDGAKARILAEQLFLKVRGRIPEDKKELALFLGFSSAKNLQALNLRKTKKTHYAEYLASVLGQEILVDSKTG